MSTERGVSRDDHEAARIALLHDHAEMKKRSPEALVKQFRDMHGFLEREKEKGAIITIMAGHAILTIKEKVEANEWEKLVKAELRVSRATIYRYLLAARAFPDPREVPVTLTMSELRLRVRAIAGDRNPKSHKRLAVAMNLKKLKTACSALEDLLRGQLPPGVDCSALRSEIHEYSEKLQMLEKIVGAAATGNASAHTSGPPKFVAPSCPPPPEVPRLAQKLESYRTLGVVKRVSRETPVPGTACES